MSLVLNPKTGTADDYHVLEGELRVGRIYKRKVAIRPEAQWLWALNGAPEGSDELASTGLAANLDDATAALKVRWARWRAAGNPSAAE